MIVARTVTMLSLGGSAIVDMWAVLHAPDYIGIGAVVVANLVAIAMLWYASNRAKRKTAAAWLKAGPTLDVILREYAARRGSPPDTR